MFGTAWSHRAQLVTKTTVVEVAGGVTEKVRGTTSDNLQLSSSAVPASVRPAANNTKLDPNESGKRRHTRYSST